MKVKQLLWRIPFRKYGLISFDCFYIIYLNIYIIYLIYFFLLLRTQCFDKLFIH